MMTTSETWVVVMRVNGESHVYSTANSRSEARAMAKRVAGESGCLTDVMTWEQAEECGLVA